MKIAVSQFTPTSDPAANLERIRDAAHRAADERARIFVAPEYAIGRTEDPSAPLEPIAQGLDGAFATTLADLSGRLGLVIVAGSLTPAPEGRVHNTLLVAAGGSITDTYTKIHLYDAFSFSESDRIHPGEVRPTVITVDGVRIGLATCYDLRFPELFRALAADGAELTLVPAEWAPGPMKEDHWLTLLRARAIENTMAVIGVDSCGKGVAVGRSATFGADGAQLMDLGAGEKLGFVDVDMDEVRRVRESNPSLRNRRM